MKKLLIIGSNSRAERIYKYLDTKIDNIEISISSPPQTDSLDTFLEIIEKYDLVVLAGLSVRLPIEKLHCPNKVKILTCHAGKLPEYRGSSPLNWALVNGDKSFEISVIEASQEFDEGAIYISRRFDIHMESTITSLREIAESNFPEMVLTAMLMIIHNVAPVPQVKDNSAYYPRRNSDDSFVDFTRSSATKIRSLVQASQPPHPFSFFIHCDKKYIIEAVVSIDPSFHGMPGKIYRKSRKNRSVSVATTSGLICLRLQDTCGLNIYEYIK